MGFVRGLSPPVLTPGGQRRGHSSSASCCRRGPGASASTWRPPTPSSSSTPTGTPTTTSRCAPPPTSSAAPSPPPLPCPLGLVTFLSPVVTSCHHGPLPGRCYTAPGPTMALATLRFLNTSPSPRPHHHILQDHIPTTTSLLQRSPHLPPLHNVLSDVPQPVPFPHGAARRVLHLGVPALTRPLLPPRPRRPSAGRTASARPTR